MTKRSSEPDKQDVENMERIEHALMNLGDCKPPYEERPASYQRNFESMTAMIAEDTLTIDQVAILRWADKNTNRPVVSWAVEDAGRIQRVGKYSARIVDGVPE